MSRWMRPSGRRQLQPCNAERAGGTVASTLAHPSGGLQLTNIHAITEPELSDDRASHQDLDPPA